MRMKMLQVVTACMMILALLVLAGCGGGKTLQRTEPGYHPSHVMVGDITPNTYGDSRMSPQSVIRMVTNNLETTLNREGVRYIPEREQETTPVPPEEIVQIDCSVTFQSGARGGEEVLITWELRRKVDQFIWESGSARSTDYTISQGATTDLRSALINACRATVEDVRELMGD